jgi:hypothetical protein
MTDTHCAMAVRNEHLDELLSFIELNINLSWIHYLEVIYVILLLRSAKSSSPVSAR